MPASTAFVTDSNRPQPLWQPPPTACLTASGAASEAPSLLIGGLVWEGKGGRGQNKTPGAFTASFLWTLLTADGGDCLPKRAGGGGGVAFTARTRGTEHPPPAPSLPFRGEWYKGTAPPPQLCMFSRMLRMRRGNQTLPPKPDQIFPTVNFMFSNDGPVGLGGGSRGRGGGGGCSYGCRPF